MSAPDMHAAELPHAAEEASPDMLRAVVAEAAALSVLEYEAQRRELAKRAGVRVAAIDKARAEAHATMAAENAPEAEAERKRQADTALPDAVGTSEARPRDCAAVIAEAADMSEAEYPMQRADLAARAGLGVGALDKLRGAERAKRRAKDANDYRSRPPPARGEGPRLPPGYRRRKDGLHFEAGADAVPLYICPPFALLGETRASNGTPSTTASRAMSMPTSSIMIT
jgi:hypothetical protein